MAEVNLFVLIQRLINSSPDGAEPGEQKSKTKGKLNVA